MEDLYCLSERLRKVTYEGTLDRLKVSECGVCGKEVCFYFYYSRTWDVLYGSMCSCNTDSLKPSSWLDVAKYYSEQNEDRREELDKIFGLEYTFKPFEKVLIAVALSSGKFFWKLDFFSHKMGDHYVCMGMASHKCLPYEGNEHLLGMDVE